MAGATGVVTAFAGSNRQTPFPSNPTRSVAGGSRASTTTSGWGGAPPTCAQLFPPSVERRTPSWMAPAQIVSEDGSRRRRVTFSASAPFPATAHVVPPSAERQIPFAVAAKSSPSAFPATIAWMRVVGGMPLAWAQVAPPSAER
ncbi:MAG: hypothetical protein IPF66_12745 [Holophagales bacterium]|nr:hypothetical protein [Holophagales bacterium]